MASEQLSDDLLSILRIIRERGGTDCSGSCHHRKPGEFHCHVIGPMLKISSQGVKNRIMTLLRAGLLERNKIEREGTYPIFRFTITPAGEKKIEDCNLQ